MLKKLEFLLILFLLVLCSFLNAQQNNNYHFTTKNGLPHDVTYDIFQDSAGFIWIGTDFGLVKFDGYKMKVFNTENGLKNNFITSINELQDKTLVVGTWGNGIYFIKNDTISAPVLNKYSFDKIEDLTTVQDRVYVKTPSYYYQYSKQNDSLILTEILTQVNEKTNLTINNIKNKAVIYNSYLLNKNNFLGVKELANQRKSIFKNLNNKIVTAVAENNNQYLIASTDSLFLANNNSNNSNNSKKYLWKLKDEVISHIVFIKKNKWILTSSHKNGIKSAYLFNDKTGTIQNLKNVYDIKTPISKVLVDHEKNLWVATFGNGVYCIPLMNNNFSYNISEELVYNNVKKIKEYLDFTLVLTNNSLLFLKDDKIVDKILLKGIAKDISIKSNKIIINSSGNFSDFQHNSFVKEKNVLAHFLLQNKEITYYKRKLHINNNKIDLRKMNFFSIYDVIELDSKITFATNKGLYALNKGGTKIYPLTSINKDLKEKKINKLLLDKDKLWLATSSGLYSYQNKKTRRYSKTDGLISDYINTIFLDHKKQLWIGTQEGVSILKNGDFIGFTTQNGINSTFISAIHEDEKKRIWLGGNKGITHIDNLKKITKQEAPILKLRQDNDKIYYRLISFNGSNSTQIVYKINDKNWVALTNYNGFINLENYKNSIFNFYFKAKKVNSDWSKIQTISVDNRLPWHKTNSFFAILFLVLLSVLLLILNKRMQLVNKRNEDLQNIITQKNKLEKEITEVRENIALDFHDDLGNRLARVSLISNMLNETNNLSSQEKEQLSQIVEDSDYLYKGTRDFIFSLHTKSDELNEVITYLLDFGESYFSKFNISFDTQIDVDDKNTVLPNYWSRQIIFIFKEAMVNVVKHAKAKNAILTFKKHKDKLLITLSDDGVGINTQIKKQNNGLLNMKKRVKKIKSNLIINSSKKMGTSITFMGKLHKNVESN